MKKAMIAIFGLSILMAGYYGFNYFRYHDVEVTSYDLLLKKSDYGEISNKELRIGAFEFVDKRYCPMLPNTSKRKCSIEYRLKRDRCAREELDSVDLTGFDSGKTYELVRLFNVCVQ